LSEKRDQIPVTFFARVGDSHVENVIVTVEVDVVRTRVQINGKRQVEVDMAALKAAIHWAAEQMPS
jgi:hypothetical protein